MECRMRSLRNCCRESRRGDWSLVIGHWSVVRGPWSVVRGPWSFCILLSSSAPSPFAYRLSPIAQWLLAIGYRPLPPPITAVPRLFESQNAVAGEEGGDAHAAAAFGLDFGKAQGVLTAGDQ